MKIDPAKVTAGGEYPMTPDFSLIPSKDILRELLSRFDHACFVGAKVKYEDRCPPITIAHTGSPDGVGALCLDAAIIISPGIRELLE